ncbi:class I SAM-dependent methyltransferase [Candidatus Woesearchaeota archaeon]|nr:class I SAM-dependent methyltransferase [Candidatus Woesearchaeota archaeon]
MIGEFFLISKRIGKLIKEELGRNKDITLDLGCGTKPYYHKNISGKVICFDKVKNSTTNVIGNANNLPFKTNTFNNVISINSFYYFDNPFDVVRDLHKILKKDGKLILVMPFFYPIHDVPVDKYRFTKYGIVALLGQYFKIDKIKAVGGIFNIPAIILHSLIKGLPLLFPKQLKNLIQIMVYVLYPLYILAQFISVFDFLDKTERFPTYYFVVAVKTHAKFFK